MKNQLQFQPSARSSAREQKQDPESWRFFSETLLIKAVRFSFRCVRPVVLVGARRHERPQSFQMALYWQLSSAKPDSRGWWVFITWWWLDDLTAQRSNRELWLKQCESEINHDVSKTVHWKTTFASFISACLLRIFLLICLFFSSHFKLPGVSCPTLYPPFVGPQPLMIPAALVCSTCV